MNDRIRAVREAVSIYDLLAERGVQVASRSRNEKIYCPVHDDRHKSAVVYPESQEVFCFTEGRTYDVVSLVQEWESLEWWEACAWLEGRVGLVYEKQDNPQDEFWRLVRSRGEPKLSAREFHDLKWEIHRSVLELAPGPVDWAEFDRVDVGLHLGKLRDWQKRSIGADFDRLEDAPAGGEAVGSDEGLGTPAG